MSLFSNEFQRGNLSSNFCIPDSCSISPYKPACGLASAALLSNSNLAAKVPKLGHLSLHIKLCFSQHMLLAHGRGDHGGDAPTTVNAELRHPAPHQDHTAVGDTEHRVPASPAGFVPLSR
jgi:hypothetical protein